MRYAALDDVDVAETSTRPPDRTGSSGIVSLALGLALTVGLAGAWLGAVHAAVLLGGGLLPVVAIWLVSTGAVAALSVSVVGDADGPDVGLRHRTRNRPGDLASRR